MRWLLDGKEFPVLSMAVHESANQFYSVIELTTPIYMSTTKLILDGTPRVTYQVVRSVQSEANCFTHTLIPERVLTSLNSITEAFHGRTTVSSLLAKMGLASEHLPDSSVSLFRIPKSRFRNFFPTIKHQVKFSQGGAPILYFNLDGKVVYKDLLHNYNFLTPTPIKAQVLKDTMNVDWYVSTHGEVDFYTYTNSGCKKSKLLLMKGFSSCNCRCNDTTGEEEELLRTWFTNEFYSHWISSRAITIANADRVLNIGDVVSLDGFSKFVVYSKHYTVPLGEEPAQVTYTIVCPA